MEELPLETTSISLDHEPPARCERRDGKRHLTLFRVGVLTVEGRRELCLIKNISSGGMSIRPYCAIADGTRVQVELKTGMAVPGFVAWTEAGTAGVSFDEPIDVLDILSSDDGGPRPRMPRVEVDCFASVRDGARVHRVRVCDISQGGLKLQGKVRIECESDLLVTLPGMPAQAASLRWAGDDHFGLTFNRVLALAELVDWLRSVREESRAA